LKGFQKIVRSTSDSPLPALLELNRSMRAALDFEQTRGLRHLSVEQMIPREERLSSPLTDGTQPLTILEDNARQCTRCPLHSSRTNVVFARGNPAAELVFVGEGPGYHEDKQGLPFVGKAGQLLDRMISAMGYNREEVYICNVVKCRPPDNRTPLPQESAACYDWLRPQLLLVAPKLIVALGRCAAETLDCGGAGGWRGQWGQWESIPVMPTYHPAFLLRNPEQKRTVWDDLKKVMEKLGKRQPSA
jgi:uracil-DNA glycosylase family 4